MTDRPVHTPDPKLDLVLERTVDVPPDLVWRGYTEPELLKQWFAPRPWAITELDIDLRPGGTFSFTMRSPEGKDYPNIGCVLDVVPKTRLVFTEALGPGFRPLAADMPFTAVIDITPDGNGGTRYTATAIHRDDAGRKQHEEMGFHQGWGMTFDQLVELVKGM
jgi:uncharacterized protein YndB with AHSA1/START domain